MKNEPIPLSAKTPRERFTELGTKVLSVSKEEIEKREKAWRSKKQRKARRPRTT
jgi:hypothetical protein